MAPLATAIAGWRNLATPFANRALHWCLSPAMKRGFMNWQEPQLPTLKIRVVDRSVLEEPKDKTPPI